MDTAAKKHSAADDWEEEAESDWDELHPRRLIPELCRLFYQLGWVTGTGGGISIKLGYLSVETRKKWQQERNDDFLGHASHEASSTSMAEATFGPRKA